MITVVLADRWSAAGLSVGLTEGSPDVGFTRVELVGSAPQVKRLRALVEAARPGVSRTIALRRIDAALAGGEVPA
jgi:hypothetical protein